MDISIWLTFVAASTALLLIPGPTILLVLSYALSHGRKVALATASGVALGDLVAMSASLAGLGALVLASAQLFLALKWLGAAYLVYMGIQLMRSAGSAKLGGLQQTRELSARECFTNATIVTALNPKSIVFFIAFVPQFVEPSAALLPQFSILIATFVGLATINALVYALLADKMRSKMQRPSIIVRLTRAGGAALVAMGIATAAVRRSA